MRTYVVRMSIAWAVLLCCVLTVSAATGNAVFWDASNPTTATGKITGQGTYVAGKGWTALTVAMSATPTGGGNALTQGGNAPANGKWGPITISDVPKGQYSVVATVTFKNGESRDQVGSPIAIVNVP